MNMVRKDAGEERTTPDTTPPFPAVLPNFQLCPIPDHASGFAQEPWIRNTPLVKIWSSSLILLIHLYQTTYISVKKNFKNFYRHKKHNHHMQKHRHKGHSNLSKHDLNLFLQVLYIQNKGPKTGIFTYNRD